MAATRVWFGGASAVLQLVLAVTILITSVATAPWDDDGSNKIQCGCGARFSKRGRVVGGDELSRGGAPWLAALARGRKPHCGAALISGVHLLTAAHCIDGLTESEMRAWLGIHSLSSAGLMMAARSLFRQIFQVNDDSTVIERYIKKALSHPDFDSSTFSNDIAVLEMDSSVQFSPMVYPLCLPTDDLHDYGNKLASVAGWGRIGENKPPSDVPRQVMVGVWPRDQCMKSGYPKVRLQGPVLCAGDVAGGVDACQGDSGGPLVLRGDSGDMEVIGVVSWGRGCARPNLPGIYTRVSSYIPFLKRAMSGTCH